MKYLFLNQLVENVECEISNRVVGFGSKVGQIGKIRDFFRSDFSTFWLILEPDLKNPGFVSFGAILVHLGPKSDIPGIIKHLKNIYNSLFNKNIRLLLKAKI